MDRTNGHVNGHNTILPRPPTAVQVAYAREFAVIKLIRESDPKITLSEARREWVEKFGIDKCEELFKPTPAPTERVDASPVSIPLTPPLEPEPSVAPMQAAARRASHKRSSNDASMKLQRRLIDRALVTMRKEMYAALNRCASEIHSQVTATDPDVSSKAVYEALRQAWWNRGARR